jgi:hypothetical protein
MAKTMIVMEHRMKDAWGIAKPALRSYAEIQTASAVWIGVYKPAKRTGVLEIAKEIGNRARKHAMAMMTIVTG